MVGKFCVSTSVNTKGLLSCMTKFAGNDAVASALGKVKLEDAVLTDDEEIEAGKDDTSTEGTEKAVVDVPEAEEVCAVV